LVIALRPLTQKHIRGGRSHYTDTCEPVDGNGAQNMVTVQSGFRTRDLSITGPTRLPPALTGPSMVQSRGGYDRDGEAVCEMMRGGGTRWGGGGGAELQFASFIAVNGSERGAVS
jgi:hypothetical protein